MGEVRSQSVSGHDDDQALAAVNEVLGDIDSVISQARQARKRLRHMPSDHDFDSALDETIDLLQQVRIRLNHLPDHSDEIR